MKHAPHLIFVVIATLCGCDASHEGWAAESSVPAQTAKWESTDASVFKTADRPVDDKTAAPMLEKLLRSDDTLASAKTRLGEKAVVSVMIDGAEGETFPGWRLYPDDPRRTVDVVLDEAGQHPVALRVTMRESLWRRADGIGMDTTSAELETRNGRPFEFYGFEWDYGGAITDWRGGRLDAKNGASGTLRLCLPENTPGDYPSGDALFSSDDPRMRANPAVVCEISVTTGKGD
ncbi:MAG: hypothetical protein IT473_07795 [Lysobacter sp.]|nr:hypothetical protein [Lysobacter sp.]